MGEVDTALQVMVKSTEFKALEALEYSWMPWNAPEEGALSALDLGEW